MPSFAEWHCPVSCSNESAEANLPVPLHSLRRSDALNGITRSVPFISLLSNPCAFIYLPEISRITSRRLYIYGLRMLKAIIRRLFLLQPRSMKAFRSPLLRPRRFLRPSGARGPLRRGSASGWIPASRGLASIGARMDGPTDQATVESEGTWMNNVDELRSWLLMIGLLRSDWSCGDCGGKMWKAIGTSPECRPELVAYRAPIQEWARL